MNNHKILIAIDDSPAAEHVATEGFELGRSLNAEFTLLSVQDTKYTGGAVPDKISKFSRDELRRNHQVIIEKVFRNYHVNSIAERGVIEEVIINTAKKYNVDLIVIGTHGRTGLSHLIMGSVAEKVLRHSPVPVMVIPVK